MRKKLYLLVGLLLFSILFSVKATAPVNAAGDIMEGDGSSSNPYQISTAEQLSIMNYDLQSNYKLIKDIDLKDKEWIPIGTNSVPFTGTFDGNGYKIYNLKLDKQVNNLGLFAYTSSSTIKNVRLVNVNIKGAGTIGALISSTVSTKIENCSVEGTGTITGSGSIGGLVGNMSGGSISNCYSTIKVSGKDKVGGLAGNLGSVTITQSYAIGDVTGESSYVGGLVGYTNGSTMTQNYATGDVTGESSYTGGLAGYVSGGAISQSYATGDVKGKASYVGGLIGYISTSTMTQNYATGKVSSDSQYVGGLAGYSDYNISESYAAGNVQGLNNVGGLVGYTKFRSGNSISDCFALGSVLASDTTDGYAGGLIGNVSSGYNNNAVKYCYSVGKVTGIGNDIGGLFGVLSNVTLTSSYYDSIAAGVTVKRPYDVGRLTTAMKQKETFTDWNFTKNWTIDDGLSYPYLKNLTKPLLFDVNNISLDKTLLAIKLGESQKLTASGTTSSIVWTSSNEAVAKVDTYGNVITIGIGKAVITAKIEGTDISASCEVNVRGIVLDKTILVMIKGESQKLTATGDESSSIIWTSSNEEVAKVDLEGTVTAVGIGKVVITGKIEGTDISSDCEVNVNAMVLNKTAVVMRAGDSQKLTATGATSGIVWTSSDETVAKVDTEGNITAISIGKAVITAKIEGTDISAACIVTVSSDLKVLDLELAESKIQLNKTVNMSLVIDNIKEIAAEDVRIKYDSSKLKFVGIDEVDGIMLVKDDIQTGELRFILASKGLANVVQTKKVLLNLYFEGIAAGDALVEITTAKISDGIEMERSLDDSECGQVTVTVEGTGFADVNKDGKFSLLDLAIDARHLGEDPATLTQYNTDIVLNKIIDSDDLIQIAKYMLEDPDYN